MASGSAPRGPVAVTPASPLQPWGLAASAVRAHRAGKGPVVVLVHGLGADHRDWRFQVPALAADYTVLVPDLPGFGGTPRPAGAVSIPAYARGLLDWLGTQGCDRVHALIGHSMGGAVVLEAALQAPDRVDRLVLCNTLPTFRPHSIRQHLEFIYRRAAVRWLGLPRLAELSAWRMFPRPEQAELRQVVIERGRGNDVRSYRAALAALSRWDARHRLPGLTLPVLWLAAEQDYFPVDWVRAAAALLPQARLHPVPGTRHGLPMEAPEPVNAALRDFLAP